MTQKLVINFLFFTLSILVASSGHTEMVVQDPQRLLPTLQYKLRSPSWETGVKCLERAVFLANTVACEYKCQQYICTSTCTPSPINQRQFELQLEECTDDSLAIYGTNGFTAMISKEEYNQTGTWIYGLLKNLDYFMKPSGFVVIDSIYPRMFSIFINGQIKNEFGFVLMGHYKPTENVEGVSFEVGFLTERNILDSLVLVRTGVGKPDDFLKEKV